MNLCAEKIPFDRLSFVAVPDAETAAMWRDRPAMTVKKGYRRFDSFERLAVLPAGVSQADHYYGDGFSDLAGTFDWDGFTLNELTSQLADVNLNEWCYAILTTSGNGLDWYSAVRIDSLTALPNGGARLSVRKLYRKLINGFWQVATEPFEGD